MDLETDRKLELLQARYAEQGWLCVALASLFGPPAVGSILPPATSCLDQAIHRISKWRIIGPSTKEEMADQLEALGSSLPDHIASAYVYFMRVEAVD